MWGSVLFIVAYAICLFIQHRALRKGAFGRFFFITGMGFVVSFVVSMSPTPIAVYVSWIFMVLTWAFVLFITLKSILRLRRGNS